MKNLLQKSTAIFCIFFFCAPLLADVGQLHGHTGRKSLWPGGSYVGGMPPKIQFDPKAEPQKFSFSVFGFNGFDFTRP